LVTLISFLKTASQSNIKQNITFLILLIEMPLINGDRISKWFYQLDC
jgi:hypothetical protein